MFHYQSIPRRHQPSLTAAEAAEVGAAAGPQKWAEDVGGEEAEG